MKEFKIELSNGIKIPAKLEYGELIYGVTAIAIGKNNNYINNNDVSTLTAKHPITGDNLKIIIYKIQQHYWFQRIYQNILN